MARETEVSIFRAAFPLLVTSKDFLVGRSEAAVGCCGPRSGGRCRPSAQARDDRRESAELERVAGRADSREEGRAGRVVQKRVFNKMYRQQQQEPTKDQREGRLEGVGSVAPGGLHGMDSVEGEGGERDSRRRDEGVLPSEAGATHRLLAIDAGEGCQELGGLAHLTPRERDRLPLVIGAGEPEHEGCGGRVTAQGEERGTCVDALQFVRPAELQEVEWRAVGVAEERGESGEQRREEGGHR
jgi:hypothetical protein